MRVPFRVLVLLFGITCVPTSTSASFAQGTAVAVGDFGTILRTTDGGDTWTPQSSGTTSNLLGVSFVDANTGTAVGGEGTILRTTDGGDTWTLQPAVRFETLFGVSFVDANTGWVVSGGRGPFFIGSILGTTDGGATWRTQFMAGDIQSAMFGVSFVDANTGIAVGGRSILRTIDSGDTWTRASTSAGARAVSFVDANTGTAVGEGGTILRTTDGGDTWTRQSRGTTNFLFGVSLVRDCGG